MVLSRAYTRIRIWNTIWSIWPTIFHTERNLHLIRSFICIISLGEKNMHTKKITQLTMYNEIISWWLNFRDRVGNFSSQICTEEGAISKKREFINTKLYMCFRCIAECILLEQLWTEQFRHQRIQMRFMQFRWILIFFMPRFAPYSC